MKVRITFEFNRHEREAVADLIGRDSVASNDAMRLWLNQLVRSTLDEVVSDYDRAMSGERM